VSILVLCSCVESPNAIQYWYFYGMVDLKLLTSIIICYFFVFSRTLTTILWLSWFCPRQPGWAGTRRNIHTHTHTHTHLSWLSIIPYLLPQSIMIHGILPVLFMCLTVFFHNISPTFLWSTSWPGTLHFTLYTFLHPIIVFFLQHMSLPSQPVSL